MFGTDKVSLHSVSQVIGREVTCIGELLENEVNGYAIAGSGHSVFNLCRCYSDSLN